MKKNYTQKLLYQSGVLISSLGVLIYLFFFNPPKDVQDNVYETKDFKHSEFSKIHFSEVSTKLGIDYRHNIFALDPGKTEKDLDLSIEPIPPSVSVLDINNDGWMDVFITTSWGRKSLLYINQKGQSFIESAATFGLADINDGAPPSFAFWGDFNSDGFLDLVYARHGCHRFFVGTPSNVFEERTEWFKGYCSRPAGVNAADFFNRGKLDLIFANFLPPPGDNSFSVLWLSNTRYDNVTGGMNHLLKNEGSEFILEEKANFKTRSFTHNAGLADINLDGFVDIFFSNDYAHDEMFLNNGDGSYKDVTNTYIPREFHGMAGMNTEFFDYNSDGRIDLYVSNVYKPPFNRHFNLLWEKKEDNTFKNVSLDVGVAKCGFSWGAKFADINNDGEPDLLVMNGRSRSQDLKDVTEGKSMWFERNEVSQIPQFIRNFYKPKESLKGRYLSAFERKCLFVQKGGEFFDISKEAGFDDIEEGRGVALIDYDNDGLMDAITSGPTSKLKIFHNETKVESNEQWIGFSFQDIKGSSIPHGLRLKFNLANGKKIIRELYPANGYKTFNDPRMHIGLGSTLISGSLEIYWPLTKRTQVVKDFKYNRYNKIIEGKD